MAVLRIERSAFVIIRLLLIGRNSLGQQRVNYVPMTGNPQNTVNREGLSVMQSRNVKDLADDIIVVTQSIS